MVGAYADFMLQTSLLDMEQAANFSTMAKMGQTFIAKGDYVEAFEVRHQKEVVIELKLFK